MNRTEFDYRYKRVGFEYEFRRDLTALLNAVSDQATVEERKRIFAEVAVLQTEAHNEMEKIGGEPLMKFRERFKMATRQAWALVFEKLTKLKWFIDPKSAPTSEVQEHEGKTYLDHSPSTCKRCVADKTQKR